MKNLSIFKPHIEKHYAYKENMYPTTVDYYVIVCLYCGVNSKQRTLNKSVKHYPQSQRYTGNPTVLRRKRKTIVEGDFQKKKKYTLFN